MRTQSAHHPFASPYQFWNVSIGRRSPFKCSLKTQQHRDWRSSRSSIVTRTDAVFRDPGVHSPRSLPSYSAQLHDIKLSQKRCSTATTQTKQLGHYDQNTSDFFSSERISTWEVSGKEKNRKIILLIGRTRFNRYGRPKHNCSLAMGISDKVAAIAVAPTRSLLQVHDCLLRKSPTCPQNDCLISLPRIPGPQRPSRYNHDDFVDDIKERLVSILPSDSTGHVCSHVRYTVHFCEVYLPVVGQPPIRRYRCLNLRYNASDASSAETRR